MKSRRTQIIVTLATIIFVAGFVLVPHEAHAGIFSPFWVTLLLLGCRSCSKMEFWPLLIRCCIDIVNISTIGYSICLAYGHVYGRSSHYEPPHRRYCRFGQCNKQYVVYHTRQYEYNHNICSPLCIHNHDNRVEQQKIKTLLVRVVLAGLFINFSLFFTKLIIDASNIIAIYIYNQIAVIPLTSGGTFSQWWNVLAKRYGSEFHPNERTIFPTPLYRLCKDYSLEMLLQT